MRTYRTADKYRSKPAHVRSTPGSFSPLPPSVRACCSVTDNNVRSHMKNSILL